MRGRLETTLALAAGLAALGPAAPASAQEGGRNGQRERSGEGEGSARVVPLPDWSIREEVDRLDTSMREYSSLTESLSRASEDLGQTFEEYKEDPQSEVLASEVQRKMAAYAKQVMADFDDIIADQDVLSANFRDLRRKLQSFSGHLDRQATKFNTRLDSYRTKAHDIKDELVELSVKIREDPPRDEERLRELKEDFARQFRRYRLQTRYVNGYQRRYQNYQRLAGNLDTLAGLFVNLHEKFNELIENLENEKQYLDDSMKLQVDQLRIRQLIHDGIIGSEHAIGNVAEKLAGLYDKVDAFGQVHDRINSDLTRFVESQEVLTDVTRKIDSIGVQGAPIGDVASDMEKAIDAFYDKRHAPEGGELLGVEDPDAAGDETARGEEAKSDDE